MHTLKSSLGRPLIAVLVAFILGMIIVMIASPGALGDRFNTAVSAYYNLVMGSFGNIQSISYTLAKTTPLIFTGLAVALAYRAGLFNIGAAGQLAVGAMVAGIIGLKLGSLPGVILVPMMLVASMLAGAFWGSIVGILKAWRGAHEVVTSIMLNWIAFYVCAALVEGPFQAPGLSQQTTPLSASATLPSLANLYNQTLGTIFGQIPLAAQYTVDVSLLLAFVALVVYWFLTSRTTFGYSLRVIGQNPKAARYAGISVKRNLVLAMALAGAFAGLAGATRLMGQSPYQLISSGFSSDSTGFDAIGVALLGRTTAIGVILSALLFGGLQQAGPFLQLNVGVPGDLIYILQALVLFAVAVEYVPSFQRFLPPFMRRTKPVLAPPLVPNLIKSEALLEHASGSSTAGPPEATLTDNSVGATDAPTPATSQED
ncbi:ABC transporter permease [Dictyobacter arantiisoli]|uniref:ABC transporter permease n=2 Tax=Dictyobacter arantiisoli TaxID=2014874 RepID=A0A5A5TE02_9CHLR|nr:ABC transporter permease [Dictyobacter arantiisoli]